MKLPQIKSHRITSRAYGARRAGKSGLRAKCHLVKGDHKGEGSKNLQNLRERFLQIGCLNFILNLLAVSCVHELTSDDFQCHSGG